MAPLQVLLPDCTLHIEPDHVGETTFHPECVDESQLPKHSTVDDVFEQRQWKRRKSMPATCYRGLIDDSDDQFAKVRFDISFECYEFSKENDSGCANAADAAAFLPYKSPSAAYFDGCDDGFGLTPVVDRCNYSGQSLLPLYPTETVQGSTPSIAGSYACAANGTAMPVAADTSSKKLSRTIQYSYDTLTSRCEETLPLASLMHASENESRTFMAGKMWELSQDVQGCREVQKALDQCKSSQEFRSVAAQLKGRVWEAMRCPHANHVLRKVAQTLPAASLDFIIQEITQEGAADVKQFVSHRYGCRIVEELLRVCRHDQLHGLMGHLLAEADALCTHMYGNFVMKAVLLHASFVQRQQLVQTLLDNVVTMGTNFYACAVLTEVLQTSDNLAHALACVLVSTSGLLSAMASHKHGKAAVEAVLLILNGAERQAAVNALMMPPLKVAKVPKAGKNQRA